MELPTHSCEASLAPEATHNVQTLSSWKALTGHCMAARLMAGVMTREPYTSWLKTAAAMPSCIFSGLLTTSPTQPGDFCRAAMVFFMGPLSMGVPARTAPVALMFYHQLPCLPA